MQYVTLPFEEPVEEIYSSAIHKAITSSTILAPKMLQMEMNGSYQIDSELYHCLPTEISIDVGSIFAYYQNKWAGVLFPGPEILAEYALLYQGDEINLDGSFYQDFDDYFTNVVQIKFGLGDDDFLNNEHMTMLSNLLYDALEAVKAIRAVLLGWGVPIIGSSSSYEIVCEENNQLHLKLKTQNELLKELL